MADHCELVSEMNVVEKMSTQERLKHARKRRVQQLKRWNQREKEWQQTKRKKGGAATPDLIPKSKSNKSYKVHFVPSVMLLEAAARNDVEEVRRLLMLGVSPDSTNEDGLTALHQCCIDDSEAMMKLLLEFGANVNAKDSEQWTPLHAAATCGHIHLVRYLISKGADLLAVNADGNMPYDICEDETTLDYIESEMAKKGITQEMIDETRAITEQEMLVDLKCMLEDGGDIEYRDQQGATPLHIAAANGYVTVVEFILDNHGSTNVCDNDMWQPIHAAACWGHPDVIEMLVMAGADLSAKTKNGETPFDICEDQDLKERIMQLKNEIETKRASQPQKVKRSHSQNTRSQSVRRTSIRDKTLISRREAREEARIRHEQQEQSGTDEEEEKLQQDMRTTEKQILSPGVVDSTIQDIPCKETIPFGMHKNNRDSADDELATHYDQNEDDVEMHTQYLNNLNESMNNEFAKHDDSCDQTISTPVIQHGQPESVKVEIHVTVNTNPPYPPNHGTLADLKKHRSDMRTRSSLMLTPSQQEIAEKMGKKNGHGHTFSTTYVYDRPPSPTISLRRFCSDPSEVVGGEVPKQGCCLVM
ncbi:protein phosphatase 1 regulatory subunit 16A [Parasteatoda tepidariorum]|uniref:Protein phosphatase 1 regulatory subunit 16A n=1 Tax=Parasteatoda tepidariorum TaxID=114398 RepID=A0A2L2YGE0_PARTP|nr:protein phosphatase 1 regulatory subunit 16A [Parasteatoda tepidariorum]XP_015907243.1 protein phosphatase 1 regulatory subunit 16A [Parasteatoda tepidariorum]XP_042902168.1 protein phosphatase 1 regulatory subunit 16A [Parasteatoda tepidariorum]XP_042902169.1 protein phosphatase 1 regulatory subunit 16A [Parasteatoda tepidariorum]